MNYYRITQMGAAQAGGIDFEEEGLDQDFGDAPAVLLEQLDDFAVQEDIFRF
jgi:hypothetical protein